MVKYINTFECKFQMSLIYLFRQLTRENHKFSTNDNDSVHKESE